MEREEEKNESEEKSGNLTSTLLNEKGLVTEVRVRPFIPGKQPKIPLNSTLTVYGKRRSGKSVFLRWFTHHALREHIPYYFAFTYTKHNSFLEGFMPSHAVFTEFTGEALQQIMNRQKKAIEEHLKMVALREDDPNVELLNPRVAVFWDDYNGRDVQFNEKLNDYYYTGRHYQTFNIFNAQYVKLTPPAIRSNTDYPILFNTDYMGNLEEYHKSFAGKMERGAFYNMFRKFTEDVPHGFLVIDNDPNVPYDEKFFAGLAEELPVDLDHIVGCKQAWKKDMKQLEEIASGKMQKKIDAIGKISKPESLNDSPDSSASQSCVWDTREHSVDPDDSKTRRIQETPISVFPPELRKFIEGSYPRLTRPKSRREGVA